jgi:hypothetical protein
MFSSDTTSKLGISFLPGGPSYARGPVAATGV